MKKSHQCRESSLQVKGSNRSKHGEHKPEHGKYGVNRFCFFTFLPLAKLLD